MFFYFCVSVFLFFFCFDNSLYCSVLFFHFFLFFFFFWFDCLLSLFVLHSFYFLTELLNCCCLSRRWLCFDVTDSFLYECWWLFYARFTIQFSTLSEVIGWPTAFCPLSFVLIYYCSTVSVSMQSPTHARTHAMHLDFTSILNVHSRAHTYAHTLVDFTLPIRFTFQFIINLKVIKNKITKIREN